MLIVSCALIYDNAIRACAVSTVTADRTGKFVLLTYSLTASHCSAEAHLTGVPFPRSFDSRLALRQSWSTRLKSLVWCGCKNIHQFCVLIKAFLVKKRGHKLQFWAGWPSLDQWLCALQMCARKTRTALDCYSNNPERLICSPCALGQCLYRVLNNTRMHALAVMHRRTLCENVESAKIKVPFYTTD